MTRWLPRIFHAGVCRLLRIRVEILGRPASGPSVMYAANHLSYLDVPVLGRILDARFVAKQDVAGWPVFGALARLQRTVFVSRSPRAAPVAAAQLREALLDRDRLVIFPEGTTSDGKSVLAFKPGAFLSLERDPPPGLVVQPLSIQLVSVDGAPASGAGVRDLYAYHADMQLLSHLLGFLRLSGARLRLTFHPPIPALPARSRKDWARQLHQRVASVIAPEPPP